jgi:hypothetical protein
MLGAILLKLTSSMTIIAIPTIIETISTSFSLTLIIANDFVDCKKKEA